MDKMVKIQIRSNVWFTNANTIWLFGTVFLYKPTYAHKSVQWVKVNRGLTAARGSLLVVNAIFLCNVMIVWK